MKNPAEIVESFLQECGYLFTENPYNSARREFLKTMDDETIFAYYRPATDRDPKAIGLYAINRQHFGVSGYYKQVADDWPSATAFMQEEKELLKLLREITQQRSDSV